MTLLVTGAAGFIGTCAGRALAARGERGVGLDDCSGHYDPPNKRDRVAALCPDVAIEAGPEVAAWCRDNFGAN